MPESPEVKRSSEELDFILSNAILHDIKVIGGKFERSPPVGLSEIKSLLPLKFKGVSSKGKMLIFDFIPKDEETKEEIMRMFAGLGMVGQFLFEKRPGASIEFTLSNTLEDKTTMYFTDHRRFGNVSFSRFDLSAKLAPDVFTIPLEDFLIRSKDYRKRTSLSVYETLMNQEKVCSGIGNYVVAETLYRAKVSPHRLFKELTDDELVRIHESVQFIVNYSYEFQGMSIRAYISPNGEKGEFKTFLQVYSKKKTPKGETVQCDKSKGDRSIWWVPSVQK